MSLRVWLPLNGDLHNQGISNYIITAVEASPTFTAGKIGQCYQRANTSSQITNGLQIQDNLLSTFGTTASVAVWVKPLGTHTHYNGTILSSGNWNSKRWAFGVSQDNSQVDVLCGGYNNYISCTVPVNQWTHLVSTFDNGVCKLYKNGTYVGEKTNQAAFDSDANWTGICRETYAGGYFGFNGCINDLRIYDHCLSAAEVKEIAQGLVLHYKLDGFQGGYGNPNLITGYDTSFLSYNDGAVTLFTNQMNGGAQEIVSNIPGASKCLHLHSSGSNNRQYRTIAATSGKSYTISVDYYSTSNQNTALHCELNGGNYSWTQANGLAYTTPGKWIRLSATYTNLTSNATLYYFIYCTNGTDCYVKNFKIEEGTSATNWVPNGVTSTIIQDSSGYGHNGTVTGNPSIVSNIPRYSSGIHLERTRINSSTGFPSGDNPNFTIAFWTKIFSDITYVSYGDLCGMYDTGQGSNTFRLELCGSPPGNDLMWFRGPSGQNGGGFNMNSSSSNGWFSKDIWHHVALVGDGANKKYYCYLDGQLCQTYNGSVNSWTPTGQVYLGDTVEATADFSDFRIYCTALLDSDIKQLYNVSMKVDKEQNVHTFEGKEQLFNIMYKPNFAIGAQLWQDGLSRYTQTNCQVNLTNDGLHIYRPANLNQTDNGSTMYGGLKIVNSTTDSVHSYNPDIDNIFNLQKGHTYVWIFHVSGNTTNAPGFQITNNMGWGGGGLTPAPSNVTIKNISSNFDSETEVWYKFTINDEIVKTCTSAYSAFVANNQYLSYKHFGWNWSYGTTGNGTDIYITNIRLYDITNMPIGKIMKNGIIKFSSIFEVNNTIHLTKNEDLILNQFIER